MEEIVKSPFTGHAAKLRQETVELPFRGRHYVVQRHYYLCQESGERFSSPAQHAHVMQQLRQLHQQHLPQPATGPHQTVDIK